MHILAILIMIMFFKHDLTLRMYLRYLHASLLELGVDKILHLAIMLVNFSSEKGFH